MIMSNRATCGFIWLFLVALVAGLLAVILPYWVSTKIDYGVKEVNLTKKIDSGLLWKYERFEAQQGSIPEADDFWIGIFGTSLHTKGLKRVTGLIMTGMALLTFSFICTIAVLCLCRRKIPFIVITVMLFLASIFLAIGVGVFYKQVLDDYNLGENEEHLGFSFWLAVFSSIATFLTGVFTILLFVCSEPEKLK